MQDISDSGLILDTFSCLNIHRALENTFIHEIKPCSASWREVSLRSCHLLRLRNVLLYKRQNLQHILSIIWNRLILSTGPVLSAVFPVWQKNQPQFQLHKVSMFCMRAFVFDWFDVCIMLTFSIPSADWNGLFVPLDSLTHTQLHLSCKSIPAAPRSDEEKRAVGHQWSSSQRTSGEAVP